MMTLHTQTSDIALDAAASRMPRRPNLTEPVRLIAEFDDDASGACALAVAVRTALRRWGIWWTGEGAGHLAYVQATWLLAHDHPDRTHLYLHAEYSSARRLLTVMVGDPGSMLPALAIGDQWRKSLTGARSADAFHHGGRDRRLRCAIRVHAPWRVRKTWDGARLEGTHPKYTFEDCNGKDDLRGTLAKALRQDAVSSAHWQGPEDRDDVWHEPGDITDDAEAVAA